MLLNKAYPYCMACTIFHVMDILFASCLHMKTVLLCKTNSCYLVVLLTLFLFSKCLLECLVILHQPML